MNLCDSENRETAPIVIKDTFVKCLLDSRADCSLIKESLANRVCSKVIPYFITVRGLGHSLVSTIGRTCVVVRMENVAVELDFFVLKDDDMAYEAVIGTNVLKYKDLRMVTDGDGSRLLLVHLPEDSKSPAPCCNVTEIQCEEGRGPLEDLLGKYRHMISSSDPNRSVSTGELRIVTKEDKVAITRIVCHTQKEKRYVQ